MRLIAFYDCGFKGDFWAVKVQGQAGDTSIIISGLQENTVYLFILFVCLFVYLETRSHYVAQASLGLLTYFVKLLTAEIIDVCPF